MQPSQKEIAVKSQVQRSVWALPLVLTMAMLVATIGMPRTEAAKPHEGATVRVIVNAEYVKYALSLVENELLASHGIKLEVEVIPGEAFVTKTLLEFNSGRSPWDMIMF